VGDDDVHGASNIADVRALASRAVPAGNLS
jgi:hypothetical protein